MILLATAATLAAQNTTPIDNDQVKVIVVNEEPHKKTSLHEHKVNRVMIYLQAGKQDFTYPDKPKTVLSFKAGEAKWSPLGGMHIAEITTNDSIRIVEVELKKPGSMAKMAPNSLDVTPLLSPSSRIRPDTREQAVGSRRRRGRAHRRGDGHPRRTRRSSELMTS